MIGNTVDIKVLGQLIGIMEKNLIKYAVQRQIQCPICGDIQLYLRKLLQGCCFEKTISSRG